MTEEVEEEEDFKYGGHIVHNKTEDRSTSSDEENVLWEIRQVWNLKGRPEPGLDGGFELMGKGVWKICYP